MAVPLLPLLTGAGAILGGIQGYRQSGGDLGSTALGALTGGTLTGGVGRLGQRMAGKALAGSALGQAAIKGGGPLGIAALAAPAAAGLGAAGLIGLPATAALAGPLGGAGTRLAGQAIGGARQAVGLGAAATGATTQDIPPVPGYTAPDITKFGPPGMATAMDPLGAIQTQRALENQAYIDRMNLALKYAPHLLQQQRQIKDEDLVRGAQATQLATALETDAAMRRQGQLGAQGMSQAALTGLLNTGATQYRYF